VLTLLARVLIGIGEAGLKILAKRDWAKRTRFEKDEMNVKELDALERVELLHRSTGRLLNQSGYYGSKPAERKSPARIEPSKR
jgi:hypothetical protein